jgi:hypothetical protein
MQQDLHMVKREDVSHCSYTGLWTKGAGMRTQQNGSPSWSHVVFMHSSAEQAKSIPY